MQNGGKVEETGVFFPQFWRKYSMPLLGSAQELPINLSTLSFNHSQNKKTKYHENKIQSRITRNRKSARCDS